MKHITLIQRLWSASHPTAFFMSLLALLVGLGPVQSVLAAAPTITSSTVFVSRNGNPNETYNANPSAPTAFDGASLGTYSINGGVLILNGGTITTTETGTDAVNGATLGYIVYNSSFSQVGAGTVTLTQSGNVNNGVRTFTVNNANINLVNIVPAPVDANGYYIDVYYDATYQVNGAGKPVNLPRDDNKGGNYEANFKITGTRSANSSISGSSILISPNTTANNTIYGASSGATPTFNGANLGTYDVDSGKLYLNGGTATVTATNFDDVSNVQLNYLVSAVGATSTANFLSLALTGGNTANGTTTYSLTAAQVNLINTQVGSLGTGNFNIQVFFSAQVRRTDGTFGTLSDNNGGTPYKAQFTVIGTPTASTTWISTTSTDWLNAANWSKGVPDRNTNAVIPAKNATNPPTITPILDDPNALYEVQDLTLSGSNNTSRAVVQIGANGRGATLHIYGDLDNIAGGLRADFSGLNGTANPLINSTIVFAGDASTVINVNNKATPTNGNQKIFGVVDVPDIRIEGTGIKSVYNTLSANNTLTFASGTSVIIRTVSADGSLNTSQTSIVDLKDSGVLFGETNTAYIEGITRAGRSLTANIKQTFGNIGIDITPNRNIPPPNISIIRTVGDPFNGPVGSSAKGVKRQYEIQGDVNNNTTSDVVFHYLNSADELNGNPEPNLVMFRTANNAVPFMPLGGTVDLTNHTVTILAYSGPINIVTLGDKNNPLPVTLTSFTAVRKNTSVLLTWATATETNNKGFYVQESADGTTFHTVGLVASQATNSTKALQYSFTDAETTTAGTRYYRLQQMDLDGKVAYFGPRVVQMDGAITANSATAYPNPFTGSLSLDLVSPSAGPALVRISDLTGRLVREQAFTALAGTSTLTLDGVNDLKSGIYVLQLVSPTGKITNLKVVKQ